MSSRFSFRALVLVALSLQSSPWAQAPEIESRYQEVQIHSLGVIEATLDFVPLRITEGAKMTFLAVVPEDNLDLEADEVEFFYDEQGEELLKLIFKGKVMISSGEITARSERAELDFIANTAVLTGNPKVEADFVEGAEADKITIDFDSERIVVSGDVKVDRIDLFRGERAKPPAAPKTEDK